MENSELWYSLAKPIVLRKRKCSQLGFFSSIWLGTHLLFPTTRLPNIWRIPQPLSSFIIAISVCRLIMVARRVVPERGAPRIRRCESSTRNCSSGFSYGRDVAVVHTDPAIDIE